MLQKVPNECWEVVPFQCPPEFLKGERFSVGAAEVGRAGHERYGEEDNDGSGILLYRDTARAGVGVFW